MNKLLITPKTKIAELLDTYPQLEEVLVKAAPQFKKLRNPILRKTVAKITSLSQAAAIGGLKTEDLVNRLRLEVGQSAVDDLQPGGSRYVTTRPDWFRPDAVVDSIDIRDMLDAGEQPVHAVLSALRKLKSRDILEVNAPFLPAPLIDKSLGLNYKHWVDQASDESYRIYFMKG